MTASPPRVYLDHNATSPLRPQALAAMTAALSGAAGNPASIHAEGRAARAAIERAREQVARLVGAAPLEVVFTSGGSEGLSAAVRGVCDRAPADRRRLVISAIEHSAVLGAAGLAERAGFTLTELPCDAEGRIDAGQLAACLGSGVALVALQWANNETGVVQPVEDAGRACRAAGVAFVVDAVQAAGKLHVDFRRCGADLLVVSAHKLGGPQGVGALVVREGVVLAPLIAGGTQERRRRAGTPGVAAIAGFGAAAEAAQSSLREESERLLRLRAKIETRLRATWPAVRIHGQSAPRLPNTVNFALPGSAGPPLIIALDLAGFALSAGSACASGALGPSHVIRAMGHAADDALAAVRLSMGWSTTADEVDRFLDCLPPIVSRLAEAAADGRGRRTASLAPGGPIR
jgi:cysteine desulfurase